MNTRPMKPVVVALVLTLGLSACADMTNRQQRALSGGAIGAAGGAAIGLMTGGVVTGALIGGGAGAAIGALMPEDKKLNK
ncbi:glycine zipper domain-containing protein [Magnetospirillum sp. 64-120]|uniref:glycine zipper domain-containing protein n=1 Tax=Magnetospirillum sp. 64-120 TaxID=1895778 RepID=UPI0009283E5F|nr:glycine zipper domain-containing protein [Magnetospirillum sp. 64-120]OJX68040.1 MAG: hypothetical protein BGO92_05090 [Magnetospirillum sp. 64-120]